VATPQPPGAGAGLVRVGKAVSPSSGLHQPPPQQQQHHQLGAQAVTGGCHLQPVRFPFQGAEKGTLHAHNHVGVDYVGAAAVSGNCTVGEGTRGDSSHDGEGGSKTPSIGSKRQKLQGGAGVGGAYKEELEGVGTHGGGGAEGAAGCVDGAGDTQPAHHHSLSQQQKNNGGGSPSLVVALCALPELVGRKRARQGEVGGGEGGCEGGVGASVGGQGGGCANGVGAAYPDNGLQRTQQFSTLQPQQHGAHYVLSEHEGAHNMPLPPPSATMLPGCSAALYPPTLSAHKVCRAAAPASGTSYAAGYEQGHTDAMAAPPPMLACAPVPANGGGAAPMTAAAAVQESLLTHTQMSAGAGSAHMHPHMHPSPQMHANTSTGGVAPVCGAGCGGGVCVVAAHEAAVAGEEEQAPGGSASEQTGAYVCV
jgi:hypothetical protein